MIERKIIIMTKMYCCQWFFFHYLCHLLCGSEISCHSKIFQLSHSRTKPTKWHLHPAKTQIRLGWFHPVWSVFKVRMKKCWVLSYPLRAQRGLWSDWVGAQVFCWFCPALAQLCVGSTCSKGHYCFVFCKSPQVILVARLRICEAISSFL